MNSLAARKVANGYHWGSARRGRGISPLVIGIIIAAVVVLLLIVGVVACCCLRRRKSKNAAGAGNGRGLRTGGILGRLGGYAKLGDNEQKGEQQWPAAPMPSYAGGNNNNGGFDTSQETRYNGYADAGGPTMNRSISGQSTTSAYSVAVQGPGTYGGDIADTKVEYGMGYQAGRPSLEAPREGRPRSNSKFTEEIR